MFTAVRLSRKKRLFLTKKIYLRQSSGFYFTEIMFSYPKNKRQKQKMYNLLAELKAPLVYEKQFTLSFKKINEYPYENFLNRVIIYAFMHFCKSTHPECCVINPCEKINENFYFTLSKYTSRIVILNSKPDFTLCRKILEFSGTPVLFDDGITKAAVLLNLSPFSVNGLFGFTFDKNIYDVTNKIFPLEDKALNIFEPLEFSAAVYDNFNRFDLVDLWAKAVANEFI